jgi:putative transposase
MHPIIQQASSHLPLERLCQLAGVVRSTYYRAMQKVPSGPSEANTTLLEEIRRVCLEWPSYGSPRVIRELRRRGHRANHKRAARLMRQTNLHCRRKKRFVVTTDSKHNFRVYPNMAKDLVLRHPDQLWRADITYVRLLNAFVYLAVILDAFSRKVVAWALSQHIDTALTLGALTMALRTRQIKPGLVHHSDQGVQYACDEYIRLLNEHHITISMSRKASPGDSAQAESFMKTFKVEEVYINDYKTLQEAYANIEGFIEIVYNQKRLHSSLDYRTPDEFEADFNYKISTLAIPETVATEG